MLDIVEFENKYAGRPIAVLGGGPSLPADLQQLPPETVLIAVNNHALYFTQPEFMVFRDIPNSQIFPELHTAIDNFTGWLVSQTPLTDINLKHAPYWQANFSSALATWLACYMGGEPVLLCGMDCFQGSEKYCHPRPDIYHPAMDAPLQDHLDTWRGALQSCPTPERIKAVSGPLVEIFGKYVL